MTWPEALIMFFSGIVFGWILAQLRVVKSKRNTTLEQRVAASEAALEINDGFLTGVEEKLEKAEQRLERLESAARQVVNEELHDWESQGYKALKELEQALTEEEA